MSLCLCFIVVGVKFMSWSELSKDVSWQIRWSFFKIELDLMYLPEDKDPIEVIWKFNHLKVVDQFQTFSPSHWGGPVISVVILLPTQVKCKAEHCCSSRRAASSESSDKLACAAVQKQLMLKLFCCYVCLWASKANDNNTRVYLVELSTKMT